MERKFAGYDFEHVGEIELERDARGEVVKYRPGAGKRTPLHRFGQGPFCRFRIAQGWRCGGIYVIECGGIACYVGECENLARIWGNVGHITPSKVLREDGNQTHCMNNNLIFNEVAQGEKVNLWFYVIEDKKTRETVKRQVIQKCNPSWNVRR